MDTIVIPPGGKDKDYRTSISGITEELVEEKGIDFETAQGEFFIQEFEVNHLPIKD